jgi:DNA-binding beta-propeller fold protein YncE
MNRSESEQAVGRRGITATVRVSLHVPTPSRGSLGLVSALALIGALTIAALFGFFVSSALGARGHQFTTTFGEPCGVLEVPCGSGKLQEPDGVAVNEATGQVYVVDKGAERVSRFSAAGNFEAEFDGSGTLPGEETEAGHGGAPGELEGVGRFEAPTMIAVDNSCSLRGLAEPLCKESDPSDGDVYVVDSGHFAVDKYSAAGRYIGQITAAKHGPFTERIDGVAVDPQGGVWVLLEGKAINRYSNATTNPFQAETVIEALQLLPLEHLQPGFAIDSAGNFYVRASLGTDFVGRIAKVAPTGAVLIDEVDGQKSSAVSVDQNDSTAFVDNLTTIGAYDSSGIEAERFGREEGAEHLIEGAGIGVDARADILYVADDAAKVVVVFGPVNPSAPTVESESAAEITADSALLQAEINPRSDEGEHPTGYQFEYGACTSASTCATSGYENVAPITEGEVGPDFEVHAVTAAVTGLNTNTTYHFKLVAHNTIGPVEGADASFTTQSAGGELLLPDARHWQLVSPPDKRGSRIEPINEAGIIEAAAAGGAITYLANAPLEPSPPGAAGKSQALSSRSPDGWSTRDISLPHQSATGLAVGPGQEYKFFNGDLSLSAVQPFGQFDPLLSEEATESTAYLHDLDGSCGSRCYRPLVTGKAGIANVPAGTAFGREALCVPRGGAELTNASIVCGPEIVGASDDLSHLILRSAAPLVAGAGENQLYVWSAGELSQLSLLPDGRPAPPAPPASFATNGDRTARRAVSTDGSRIEWEAEGMLYQRDSLAGGGGETAQLDEGAGCGTCESGGGQFQIASIDGRRLFFTDTRRLTADSGAEPGVKHEADLYECRMVLEGTRPHCDLTDLTPANGGEGANVQGDVLGASEDGEYIYFVALGAQAGSNATGHSPTPGQPNLYLRHDGTATFIATLSNGDGHDWFPLVGQPARVSPNGHFLALMSQANLTGYDNRDATSGQPTAEVYLFDAATMTLRCASCDPSGARPVGVEYHPLEPGSGGLVGGPTGTWLPEGLVAANLPGTEAPQVVEGRYQPRYLSNEGRLFFNTINPLVPQDSNGTQDVYEYEPPGVGGESGCKETSETFSSRSGGCVSLISSGSSSQESAFLDASESGDDVFFLTYSRLAKADTDNALDIYDAHSCTASVPCLPEPPAPPEPCKGEGCQAHGAASAEPSPSTSQFVGPGNPGPARKAGCPKGKVKKGGRCVKKSHKPKGHKKSHRAKKQKGGAKGNGAAAKGKGGK